jgi:phage gp36-like protein
MSFIEKSDYPQSIHADILDALTRDDDSLLPLIEERNISLMKGYLEGRYDTEKIFTKEEGERNRVILGILLDLILYDVFSIHNPQKLSQVRKDRHDRALEWLKAVQKGNIVISGAPRREDIAAGSGFCIISNPKRDYRL